MIISKKLYKYISFLLILSMLVGCLYGCGKQSDEIPEQENEVQNIDTAEIAKTITDQIQEEVEEYEAVQEKNEELIEAAQDSLDYFVYKKLYDEYSAAYDTFDAAIKLPDGSEIYGIGYSDLSSYLETDDGSKGFFPAGFLTDAGDVVITEDDIEKGLEVENLSYNDGKYGFVLAYKTEPYLEHCVINGKYLKYGIDDNGVIVHEESDFSKDACDTELGALYSYDENKYVYNPNVGEHVELSGQSLFESVDFNELQAEINRILDEQDFNFSSVDVDTTLKFAQEAVDKYLSQFHEESFMGVDVKVLREEVKKLDPNQCIRFTPNGNVIVDIDESIPNEPTAMAKWVVGISCGIAVAGSIALGVFVPAATPVSGAICGAAIDVFMQVVIENNAVENINWGKVAIASTSGALMAWACPLGAGVITQGVATKTGSAILGRLAGYGFLTFSNAVVSGSTNAAFAAIDKKSSKEVWDSFLIGAAVGACCTVAASALSELGHAGMNALRNTHPENWFIKLTDGASQTFANLPKLRFSDKVESVLVPKSIYEASQAGVREYNLQATLKAGKKGGAYSDVRLNSNGDYTQVHETPSFDSTGADVRKDGPSIKMTKEDHMQTGSYGNSKNAHEYRAMQKEYIDNGNYHDAIQMDIDDIHSKFNDKYDDAIEEMLEYAKAIGWW